MLRLKEKYKKEITSVLKKDFDLKNVMACPSIEKVVINTGIGRISKEKEVIEKIKNDIGMIAGQQPVLIEAKKSIASFKVRQGSPSGIKVTLRGQKMYDFLDRLIHVAFPRTRDFRGIDPKNIDRDGNFNIGIKENIIFPETDSDDIRNIFGMEITIVSSARDRKLAERLFRLVGFPLKK